MLLHSSPIARAGLRPELLDAAPRVAIPPAVRFAKKKTFHHGSHELRILKNMQQGGLGILARRDVSALQAQIRGASEEGGMECVYGHGMRSQWCCRTSRCFSVFLFYYTLARQMGAPEANGTADAAAVRVAHAFAGAALHSRWSWDDAVRTTGRLEQHATRCAGALVVSAACVRSV